MEEEGKRGDVRHLKKKGFFIKRELWKWIPVDLNRSKQKENRRNHCKKKKTQSCSYLLDEMKNGRKKMLRKEHFLDKA